MDTQHAAREISELYRLIYDRFHRRSRPSDYLPSRETLGVLQHLRRSGPITITEAMAHFDRSQAAISEIMTRMQKHELIERVTDERDRRRNFLWLTPKGEQVLSEGQQVLSDSLLEGALDQMPPDARRKLVEGMQSLLQTKICKESENDGFL